MTGPSNQGEYGFTATGKLAHVEHRYGKSICGQTIRGRIDFELVSISDQTGKWTLCMKCGLACLRAGVEADRENRLTEEGLRAARKLLP